MSTDPIVETTQTGSFLIWCPACDEAHQFTVPPWGYDGNFDCPTITGSILVNAVQWAGGSPNRKRLHTVDAGQPTICHSFVNQGTWDYLGDCTHIYAGQTLEAIPFRAGVKGIQR